MKYFIPFILLLSSCSIISIPSYTTSHGVKIHDKTGLNIPERVVEEAVAAWQNEFGVENRFIGKTHIYLYNKLLQINNEAGTMAKVADGYADIQYGVILISVFTECMGNSGIVHELTHLLFQDFKHESKELWARVEKVEEQLQSTCTPEQMALDKEKRDIANAATR